MGDRTISRVRRRLDEAAMVLEVRWPALLEQLVTMAETAIVTELSTVAEEKIGESSIPG